MPDLCRKIEMIRSIEYFQLSNHLISALDDAQTAHSVINAVNELIRYTEQWN